MKLIDVMVLVYLTFSRISKIRTADSELFDTTSPIPTVAEITARQKAEFEVFAYLDTKIKKRQLLDDPVIFGPE
ncbi:hypothetical protein niasHT_024228 [Heterodera trifolii]|uniref:Uncharacterized protein n=1 Tax=Heterodera trifolii TaxID=157864 RepID=A0ABD2JM05_9BILA